MLGVIIVFKIKLWKNDRFIETIKKLNPSQCHEVA